MKTYFKIKEFTDSWTANKYNINNKPNSEITNRLKELISFLNPIREEWGSAIKVNSGYRCPELNKLVGGSPTSSHLYGWAADIQPVNGKILEFQTFMRNYLKDKDFDQCILYSTFVHIGLFNKYRLQRRQIFSK